MSEVDEILDHPCKQTCSGWRQGHEKGRVQGREEVLSLLLSEERKTWELDERCADGFPTMYQTVQWLRAKLREGDGK